MSGIYGVVRKDGAPVHPKSLARMQTVLASWGRDGHGCWQQELQKDIALGHFMLHETPESRHERLPSVHPQYPHLAITADARIDNRAELLAALDIPMEQATVPDSLLILSAYARWGEACARKLLGAFAFAIWDARRRRLFCARDHIGFKPFIYYDGPRTFVFGSTVKTVLAHPDVPRVLSEPLIAAYLQQFTYYPELSQTYWADVVKLPPAHYLTLERGYSRLVRYWSPADAPKVRLASDAEYAFQLRELLHEAVECRLRRAAPVGAHLSGGLDSTTVAVMATRSLRRDGQMLQAFSWSPSLAEQEIVEDHQEADERTLIEKVCAAEEIELHYTDYSLQDVLDTLTVDFTLEPTEMIMREAQVQDRAVAEGLGILLSGWGGDEVVSFNGRGYLASLLLQGRLPALHQEFIRRIRRAKLSPYRSLRYYAHLLVYQTGTPIVPNWLLGHWDPWSVYGLMPVSGIDAAFAAKYAYAVQALRAPPIREQPGIHFMQRRLLENGHITRRIESWATSGAPKGLIYRYPLLDRRILEFCLGIPARQFLLDGWSRSILRRATGGILPPEIQWLATKAEPAAFAILDKVFPDTVPALCSRIGLEERQSVGAQYVDVEKIRSLFPVRFNRETLLINSSLTKALTCFFIGQSRV